MPESHVLEMVEVIKCIDPNSASADANGSSVDVSDYRSVAAYVYYGTNGGANDGSNYFACHLEDSPDDSTFTDVSGAANLVGSTANLFGVNNGAADDNAVYALGYRGNARYLRVVLDETGTVTATPVCIFFVGIPKKRPATYTVQGS